MVLAPCCCITIVKVWAQHDLPEEWRGSVSTDWVFFLFQTTLQTDEVKNVPCGTRYVLTLFLLLMSRCTLLCSLQLVIYSAVIQRLKSKGIYPKISPKHPHIHHTWK